MGLAHVVNEFIFCYENSMEPCPPIRKKTLYIFNEASSKRPGVDAETGGMGSSYGSDVDVERKCMIHLDHYVAVGTVHSVSNVGALCRMLPIVLFNRDLLA